MRHTALALAATLCLVLFSSSALAQKKKIKQLEGDLKNLESDIEVLQEFIQEQSTTLTLLKKKVAEADKLREEVKKLNQRITGNTELSKKSLEGVDKANKGLTEESGRVDAIEEKLKKKVVDFHGQIRIRPEIRSNHLHFNNLLDEDRNFTASHRALIGVDVRPSGFVTGRFTLQDARIWGSPTLYLQKESVANPPEDRDGSSALKVHEAFGDIVFKEEVASLRLGRQVLNFGAGRMVGNNDWEQAGRAFDGLDLTLQYKNFIKADLFAAWVEERHAFGETDSSFSGIYLTCPYVKDMAFDLYYLFLYDVRGDAKRSISTIGLRIGGKLPWHKALFFDLEGALQFGDNTEGKPTDNQTVTNSHYGVYLHMDLGYAVQVKTTPTLAIFFDMASGDGNTSPTDSANDLSAGWVPLFATKHSMLGRMDMWNQTNIWDLGGYFKITPAAGFDITLEIHSLHLYDKNGAIPGGGDNASVLEETDGNLGFELDIDLAYRFNDNFAISGGYSLFAPGQGLKDRDDDKPLVVTEIDDNGEPTEYRYPVGDPAHWVYLQADFTF